MTTSSPLCIATPDDKTSRSRKRKKSDVPQPGEPGYKTPTQLRNERKRRAKKQRTVVTDIVNKRGGNVSHPADATSCSSAQKKIILDPSSRYLHNPMGAPLVQKAITFFKTRIPQLSSFDIHPLDADGATLTGWRTVAKLAVRAKDGKTSIGLFAPNSHDLLPVPNCAAHHPSINATVVILEKLLNRTNPSEHRVGESSTIATAFDEVTGKGHLRHIAINVERSTGKVQITLIWNSPPIGPDAEGFNQDKKVLDLLTNSIVMAATCRQKRRRGKKGKGVTASPDNPESVPEQPVLNLHSLWVHFNSSWKHSNAIFSIDGGSDSWMHVFGPLYIEETLSIQGQSTPIALRFPPNVFRQANLDAFSNIVQAIRSEIKSRFPTSKPSCIELYGGVGTIGLNVADLTSRLISSDANPNNIDCFLASAALLNDSSNALYDSKDAIAMVHGNALEKGRIVIIDPPRKGLEDEVLAGLCNAKVPELLVYVSCGFDAFQRDCNALLKSGWKLFKAEGHLLFPGSDAIETLAFFDRTRNV